MVPVGVQGTGDNGSPTITNVGSTTSDGTLKVGDVAATTVTFSGGGYLLVALLNYT